MISREIRPGLFVHVDDQDLDILNRGSWYVNVATNGIMYARRTFISEGKKRSEYLHRAILNVAPSQYVDHIDGDTFNCTRKNLRIVTRGQNNSNKPTYSKHGLKGVKFHPDREKPWAASITDGKKTRTLGYFRTVEEAALRRDEEARKIYGNFATFNFPKAGEISATRAPSAKLFKQAGLQLPVAGE